MLHSVEVCKLFCFWITQFHLCIIVNPNPSIERLSECGVDSVNEGHCVRDAVEGQSSCSVIHIHSYSRGAGDYRECNAYATVQE